MMELSLWDTIARNVGTDTPNRDAPVYRWYPYLEAFSSELVEMLLSEAPGPREWEWTLRLYTASKSVMISVGRATVWVTGEPSTAAFQISLNVASSASALTYAFALIAE